MNAPMNESPWFDEVSQTYLKHFAELEAARVAYGAAQQRVVEHLMLMLLEEMRVTGFAMNPRNLRAADANGFEKFRWEVWFESGYSRVRMELKKAFQHDQAGLGVALGPHTLSNYGSDATFRTYAWFRMGRVAYRHLEPRLLEIQRNFAPGVTVDPADVYDGQAAYIRFAVVRGSEIRDLTGLEHMIRAMPTQFLSLDPTITRLYAELRWLADEG
jgi:hypothetical protein